MNEAYSILLLILFTAAVLVMTPPEQGWIQYLRSCFITPNPTEPREDEDRQSNS